MPIAGEFRISRGAKREAVVVLVTVGCMVATSLAMVPASLGAQMADWVDLDGPLRLARDCSPGLAYEGALLLPPTPELWG